MRDVYAGGDMAEKMLKPALAGNESCFCNYRLAKRVAFERSPNTYGRM